MTNELHTILFLDIETVAVSADYKNVDERLKTHWSRKAAYLKKNEAQTDEELFNERAGIYAEFGKIVCIAVGRFFKRDSGVCGIKTKAFYGHDEYVLLNDFKKLLDKTETGIRLCAHNGKEFDFPYLCRRMLIHGIPLPSVLNLSGKKPWQIEHVDTLELWKFGDHKHYTSLDLLTTIFNIPSSKSDMDGSRVNEVYYKLRDLEKIKNYCVSDIIALAQLYLRMKGHPLIDEADIITKQA